MKKIICFCTLLACMSLSTFAQALVLKYPVSSKGGADSDQNKIYTNFVEGTLVARKTGNKAKGYHVTVGWIDNVGENSKLGKFLKSEARKMETFDYEFGEPGILEASSTCPDPKNKANPLNTSCKRHSTVLRPAANTVQTLKLINKELNNALDRFNELNKTKYKMNADLLPQYFDPHFTLATSNEIKGADRAKGVADVKEKMKNNSSFYSVKLNKH